MTELPLLYTESLRVNFNECDFNQHWKPGFIWQHLTECASIHAGLLGWGYEVMLAQNLFWVHSRMKVKFHRLPTAGEQVTIHTWPKTVQQKLFFIRDFEVLDPSGARVASATSAWLVVNATTRRMVPTGSLDLQLPSLPERIGLDEPLDKIGSDDHGEERLRLRAGYSAVDMLGHVNNSRYVEWICDCFPIEHYQTHTLDWIQVNYEHEIRPGEEVALLAAPSTTDGDLWQVTGLNQTNQSRAFESALKWRV